MLNTHLRLSPFETDVVAALLTGDPLQPLRVQLPLARVAERETTGSGLFVTFSVDPGIACSVTSLTLSDLHIEMVGMTHGAGAILYVADGLLHMLECVTNGHEAWSTMPAYHSLQYLQSSGLPSTTRDPSYIASILG